MTRADAQAHGCVLPDIGINWDWPDPEIAHVLVRLVGEEHTREHREGVGAPFGIERRQAIKVRAAGSVRVGCNIGRDLELTRQLHPQRAPSPRRARGQGCR